MSRIVSPPRDVPDRDPAALVEELERRHAEAVQLEAEADKRFQSTCRAIEKRRQVALRAETERYQGKRAALEQEARDETTRIAETHGPALRQLEKEYAGLMQAATSRRKAQAHQLEKERANQDYEANMLFEANKQGFKEKLALLAKQIETEAEELALGSERLDQILNRWGVARPGAPAPDVGKLADPIGEFRASLARVRAQLVGLEAVRLPGFAGALGVMVGGVAALALALVPLGWLLGWTVGPALSLALGFGSGLAVRALGRAQVRGKVEQSAAALVHEVSKVTALKRRCLEEVNAGYRHERARLKKEQALAEERAAARLAAALAELEARRKESEDKATREFEARKEESRAARAGAEAAAAEKYPRLLAECDAEHRAASTRIDAEAAEQVRAATEVRDDARAAARAGRNQARDAFLAALEQWNTWLGGRFASWESLARGGVSAHGADEAQIPPVLPLGTTEVSAPPIDPKLENGKAAAPRATRLPALFDRGVKGSLLIKIDPASRPAAEQALLTLATRALTSFPSGQARLTIIDPVGLGQSFAALMQLADSDEALVTSRIWTEQQLIGQRLLDLTEHMETVIQKYLRNDFESIEEYNRQAGEVAEPYRFLVVANFPVNFGEEQARRLLSIAQSGPRCGVHVLLSVDPRVPLPPGFELADLEAQCLVLEGKEGCLAWRDGYLAGRPIEWEAPPTAEEMPRILRRVGESARGAKRVRVPFEFIAPPAQDWWKGDASLGVRVPLGRAGATKRQALDLGQGTSQHVLIAGKTGSGKTTLLHALVTNIALTYSPREVELYLVDFKKGVEFKVYASHALPHARVVAIESDREFGHSVMERLDRELRLRGEQFRAAGVQDLAGYRRARPAEALPRVLLVIDEFQELFVEDDRIAQDAALLLDRLVRQGRAFGIHVLLGSQTLGGAYSLARSTLGQMAVRIALQCAEADAHLILSEENTAARLLSRPGEAIYNDANGLAEGNHPFQVVWLGDEERESYLERIVALAKGNGGATLGRPIIFEGNAPADLAACAPLLATLGRERAKEGEGEPAVESPNTRRVWLGDAIAIKDPTSVTFRPTSGSSLVIVGQREEPVVGMTMGILVALAAQAKRGRGPEGAVAWILDGTPVDSPYAGKLASLARVLGPNVAVGGAREVADWLGKLGTMLDDRRATDPDKASDQGWPPVFLIVQGIQRFRDLRKEEDDFGFSRSDPDTPPSPAKRFAELAREGPALGIHLIIWADSLTSLQRALDRNLLREFEARVLLQMSANDSTVLTDTQVAARLGPRRALLVEEETGRQEKFRPFGVPAEEWLEQVTVWLATSASG